MELRQLRYFLAVTREQSISKAAEALFITQPNLSRQMQNLEKEIGQQLFIRGTKKITLTEAGQLLYKRAEEIIELYNQTEAELNIVATGNLLYNMSLLVEAGAGYAVTLDKIINTSGNSDLCFRPLYPELISHLDIAWKKYQVFPKCTEIFLERLKNCLREQ